MPTGPFMLYRPCLWGVCSAGLAYWHGHSQLGGGGGGGAVCFQPVQPVGGGGGGGGGAVHFRPIQSVGSGGRMYVNFYYKGEGRCLLWVLDTGLTL